MSEKSNLISLMIDGVPVDVAPGTTILEAAQQVGIDIPYLCHEPRLRPFGACRICLVEVKGGRGPIPACTSPVAPNMEVTTSNEKIDQLRRNVLELLLVHHPLDCPVCDKAGECTLQDLVYKYGPTGNRYLYGQSRFNEPVDNRSPFIQRNSNRCVLCGACARICNEVQSVGEISFVNRGFKANVGTLFDQPLNCEFCGQCVSACPVGALNNAMFRNQSRVWDLDKTQTTCAICGNGCTYNVEVRDNDVYRITHDIDAGINRGVLCGKGRFGYGYLHREDRLTDPMIKKGDAFEKVTWDEALDFVADKLKNIIKYDGPGAVGVLGSPHGTNEDAKALRLLFGDLLRVKNLDSQARYFLAPTLDVIGENTGTFQDVQEADLFLVLDSATTNSQPVLGNRIVARHRNEEVPLVVIDPRYTKQARFADLWLAANPGTSAEVLAAIGHKLDTKAEAFASATPKPVTESTGVDDALIAEAVALLKEAKKPVIVLGTWPYSEEINAKNARTAYALAAMTGAKVVIPVEKANLRGLLRYGVRPIGDGLDATEIIEQAGQGAIKALFILGDNPVANYPGGAELAKALAKVDLLVVSELFMTATAQQATVVLPALATMEKAGTLTNYEGREQTTAAVRKGPGLARSDAEVLVELAGRLSHEVTMDDVKAVKPVEGWTEPGLPELSFKPFETAKDRFAFLSGPVLFQCGSLTTYSAELGDVYGETLVEIHPDDAKALNLVKDDMVKLTSASGQAVGKVLVSRNVNKGIVFAPNHYPEAGINNLFGAEEGGEMVFVTIDKA